jgi:hypothetical protein
VKEQVLQAIQRLPNDIDFRDVTDEIALLAAVQEAERDIQDGRLSHFKIRAWGSGGKAGAAGQVS